MEDHLSAQCRVIDMSDDQLMQICNACAEEEALSALGLAAIDELLRRGVVKGPLGLGSASSQRMATHP